MSTSAFPDLEPAGTGGLRAVVETIDSEIAGLVGPANTGTHRLAIAWAELVRLLSLGPAPEVRECPSCGRSGMRAATRCGYCWTALPPLPAAAPSLVAAEASLHRP
jgi:hypothetical protein